LRLTTVEMAPLSVGRAGQECDACPLQSWIEEVQFRIHWLDQTADNLGYAADLALGCLGASARRTHENPYFALSSGVAWSMVIGAVLVPQALAAVSRLPPVAVQSSSSSPIPAAGSVNVTTWHNDIGRTGLNANETLLTPTNVNKTQFGKICSASVDAQIYAQPLVMTNVSINGQVYASVVYVVTQNDSVYAFDANSEGPACTQLLFTSLLQAGEFAVDCTHFGGKHCGAINPLIGILGTPVIDTASNALYLISQAQVGNPPTAWIHRIHALNITNLAEMFNGPAVVSGTYGALTFSSSNHIQRPGLLLLPGNPPHAYAAFSVIDWLNNNPPSGWIFRYNARDLSSPPVTHAPAPTGSGAGIWQGGAGMAAGVDSTGGQTYLYFSTADGTFDADPEEGGSNYGEGVVLIPPGVIPAHPYIAVSADKEGSIYVMDRAAPGGYGGTGSCLGANFNLETVPGMNLIHNTPAYWNRNLFFAPTVSAMMRYNLSSTCSPGPVCTKPVSTRMTFPPGATPSISVNGSNVSSGVLWAIWGDRYSVGGPPAVLYAINPANMTELYDSTQCGTQDTAGAAVKFTVPTIANGKVFVGTQTELDIYGESFPQVARVHNPSAAGLQIASETEQRSRPSEWERERRGITHPTAAYERVDHNAPSRLSRMVAIQTTN